MEKNPARENVRVASLPQIQEFYRHMRSLNTEDKKKMFEWSAERRALYQRYEANILKRYQYTINKNLPANRRSDIVYTQNGTRSRRRSASQSSASAA